MIRRFFPHVSVVAAIVTSTFAASLGLIGGVALQSVEKELFLIVPLLVALPAMNMMAGDYASLIAAHAGDLQYRKTLNRKLLLSLSGSLPISITGVIVISILIANYQGYAITRQFMLEFSAFVAIAMISTIGIVYLLINLLDTYLSKRRVNSDDVLIPFANVLASILMLGWIAFAAWTLF